MDPTKSSSIGRPIDLRYPSNRFALAAATTAALAWAAWKWFRYDDLGDAALRGLVAFGATFVAWALARELDPDRPWTAGVAAAAAAVVLGAGVPSLLIGAAALLAARVTARTTGRAPLATDLIVLVGLAAWVGAGTAGLPAGLVVASVLAADRWLPGGAHPWTLYAGILAAAGAAVTALLWGASPAPGFPSGAEWVVVPLAVLGVAGLGRPASCSAHCDLTGDPVSVGRVRLARAAAFGAAAGTFLWAGGPGLTAGSVVWAALAATALPGRPRRD